MSFFDDLLESAKESESPERYFWWSGIAAISAAIRKRVYLQRGPFYKLFPNVYIALVSEKSGLRKGIPIAIIKGLVESLDCVRVISGCNSVQALIKELSMQQTFKSGAVVNEAQGLLVSDEFESFLIEDARALTYLTALHNTHEHPDSWKKRLKGSPLEELKSPCLTLLVASNEALFNSVVKEKDIEGGFIARTFLVFENKRKRINALVYTDEEVQELLSKDSVYRIRMIERLRQITLLEGEMHYSPEAAELYKHWYDNLATEESEDKTGATDRLGDQVLKVAMLLSISERNDLIISQGNVEEAISKSEECLIGTRKISMEQKTGELSPLIAKVLKEFIKAPNQEVARKKLMMSTHIESHIMDRIIETLTQRGAIGEPKRNGRREICYQMKREVYEAYIGYKVAIN